MICLGLDTSNYTTSVALYDTADGSYRSVRRLLPVEPGSLGLRQSDAVFHHTARLSGLLGELFENQPVKPEAVAVSVKPSEQEGSYMPCFLVGRNVAYSLGAAFGVPVYPFSHQLGHIGAVLASKNRGDVLNAPFFAFHLSGGTTDALFCEPDPVSILRVKRLGGSTDLKAGQAIDRVGAMLGLPFPAGPALERLADESGRVFSPKPSVKGTDCSFSGLENQCRAMLANSEPAADIAKYCLTYIVKALEGVTASLTAANPDLPVVFSGGVTANGMLRNALGSRCRAVFAKDSLASDNAVGAAYLGALRYAREEAGAASPPVA